ncbi:phage major capsid protein [Variovorax sp. Varisp41]|uniref:phage major capsid protein n=1 Tax=Variovorax sp. Varisp41 TaxID=3243033 RepID=UPI0039B54262
MKLTRNHLTIAFLAVVAVACVAAFAGHPVTNYIPHDVLGALGAAGALPFAMSGEVRTVAEQISAFEASRQAKAAELAGIMTKASDEGRTLDDSEAESYDTLKAEVEQIDKHLGRLRDQEKLNIQRAAPVKGSNSEEGAASRAPAVIKTQRNDEPGIGFARFALSMFAAKGDVNSAKAFAENKFGQDTRLQNVMKAAVAAGTTTSPTWAGNLVDYQNLSSEFIEFLRPRTIVGQFGVGGIPALRRVPFNSRIPGKTSAGSAQWVGEGYRKPVTAAGYSAATLKWAKIAAISVVTEELERFSDPAIVQLTRDDLADAVIERMDVDFVDPAKAAGTGAGESPASVTNAVTPIPSTGTDADGVRADIAALWATADATNLPASSAVYITDAKTARNLSLMRNPLGAREFPDVRVNGAGSIDGVPLLISNYVPSDTSGSLFILAFASEIYLADDGQVNIDISREATIFLDDAAATATPTAAQLVSMFQTNQLAIRAERYVRWQKRRPQAVAFLNGVQWGQA